MTSSHVITRVKTIAATIETAAIVASILNSLPKIQRMSASPAKDAIKISFKLMVPIFLSSSAAQAGASGEVFCVGG